MLTGVVGKSNLFPCKGVEKEVRLAGSGLVTLLKWTVFSSSRDRAGDGEESILLLPKLGCMRVLRAVGMQIVRNLYSGVYSDFYKGLGGHLRSSRLHQPSLFI